MHLKQSLWQNTLSLWAALPQSMPSSSSAKSASKTSSQTPKLCMKCKTKCMRGYFFAIGVWKNHAACRIAPFFWIWLHLWKAHVIFFRNITRTYAYDIDYAHLTSLLFSNLADFVGFWIFFLVMWLASFFFFLEHCISAKSFAFGAFSCRKPPFGGCLLSKYGLLGLPKHPLSAQIWAFPAHLILH